MKTYQLSTEYRTSGDEIIASIKKDEKIVGQVFFMGEDHQIYCNADVNSFQVVNHFELYARIIQALLAATDDETEIPMHIEHEIDVQL